MEMKLELLVAVHAHRDPARRLDEGAIEGEVLRARKHLGMPLDADREAVVQLDRLDDAVRRDGAYPRATRIAHGLVVRRVHPEPLDADDLREPSSRLDAGVVARRSARRRPGRRANR